MIVDAGAPIVAGRTYRMTFRVRGPAWGTAWVADRAKSRVWDELAAKGCRLLSWEVEGESFRVTFDKPASPRPGDMPMPNVPIVPAVIAVAIAASLLFLALAVTLQQVEDLGDKPGAGLAFTGWLILAAVVFVAWLMFRRAS